MKQPATSATTSPSPAAGSDTLFSDDSITLIHDTSRGLPRTVNNLCIQSLIAACAAGHAIADQSAARAAITEVTPPTP